LQHASKIRVIVGITSVAGVKMPETFKKAKEISQTEKTR
jgi:hypothetical protein